MPDRLRAVIVDDEPAARARLRLLCADRPELVVVGEAGDGAAALELLNRVAADLLFLDIEMPGMDGMTLARRLGERADPPAVVFVTAFERFAVAAWGVHATGYLLKPVDPDSLAPVVARLVAAPSPDAPSAAEPQAFWAPHRSELVRVPVEKVDWIAGEDDYARLHVGPRSYLVPERLYVLEARLGGAGFLRVHRSTLVRINTVTALRHAGAGAWTVELCSGVSLPIGRSCLGAVREALRVSG